MSTPPIADASHRHLLKRTVELICVDRGVSQEQLYQLLDALCTVAFNDGCIATNRQMLADLLVLQERDRDGARLQ